jgi:hypothetical protein
MQELVSAKLNDFVAFQMWRYDDPELNAIMAGAKNADFNQDKDRYNAIHGNKSAFTGLQAEFLKGVNEYEEMFSFGKTPEAARFIKSMTDSALKAYVNHAASGGTISVDDFIGMAFSEETLNTPHAKMIIPEGVDRDMVTVKTERLRSEAFESIVPLVPEGFREQLTQKGLEIDDPTLASALRSNGVFILNKAGDGVRFMYDARGIVVPVGNVEFSFADLAEMSPPRKSTDTGTRKKGDYSPKPLITDLPDE